MLSFVSSSPRLCTSLLAVLGLLAGSRAQDAPPPAAPQGEDEVVRVSAELVQTDVMVFDRQGRFVDGLKPEQFELKVDGRAVPIAFFERVEAGTVDEDAQLAAARGGARTSSRPAGVALPLDRGRTILFFVDDLHLSPASAARTRDALVRFIDEELGQNDEAAVTSASGQIGFLQQFTGERAVLRAAAARLKAIPYDVRDGQSPPMSEAHALAIGQRDPNVTGFFVDDLLREIPSMPRSVAENMVATRAREILRQSQYITDNTLRALESAVRSSAPLPGRKILFFISEGFHLDPQEGTVHDRLRRITDAAARAGVVIYSMDAAGLRSGLPDAAAAAAFDPAGRLTSAESRELRGLQEPLHTLAADTGGRALVNTNAMGPAVEGALKETARYYLLAWRPEGGGRGAEKFRRIEVGVRGRADLNVLVRRGFYAGAAPAAEAARRGEKKPAARGAAAPAVTAAERDLRAAIAANRPRAALPTSLSLNFINTPGQGTVVSASVGLDRAAFDFTGQPPEARAAVDLLGFVLDDRGRTVSGFKHGLTFDPREAARPRILHTYQIKLGPGLYQVRVAVRDQKTGRTGSAYEWVEVPDFGRGELTLSSIYLAERASGQPPETLAPDKLSEGVLLNVDRRFARTSWMRFVVFINNAAQGGAARPDVALQVQVFRDDQPVFTAPLIKVRADGPPDGGPLPYAAELPLETFPPGRYALRLTAIDRTAKATAQRRVNFTVE
ncbi:MAG TPA: VWA domain-containing protein [Pyrinomonadaceae bacterium]|nr:VWA domain-containing protein [Pyrinomonadaceae bacterium]